MYRKSAYFLFLAVLGLLVIGIVMLFSTSAFAKDSHGDPYFFLKHQSLWLGVGLAVCIAGAVIDYHFWQRTWWIWLAVATITLIFCFVPHLGMRINGSRRWIGFGPIGFQPSEIAKLAAVFFLAWWFARYENATKHPLFGFPILLGLLGIIGGSVIFVAATHSRMERLIAFTDLERYKQDAGLQQMQALIAWGSGGMEGLGLGNGRQKMLYLPYAHTDFIFPMIGEELGLRISLLVVFLFVVVIVCGIVIALHAKDRFGLLTASGVICLLALQAAVNIGVTTSLLPNKGLPLPFISYGGSNLVACLFGVGLLLNIYRQAVLEPANKKHTSLQVRMTPRI